MNDEVKKKAGRKEVKFDWEKLNIILRFGGTKKDSAEIMEVSEDTIERRIKKEYDMTFTEYKTQKMAYMRMKILQKQYEVAMRGNVSMLIWLGKQNCNQVDKQTLDHPLMDGTYSPKTIELVAPDESTSTDT